MGEAGRAGRLVERPLRDLRPEDRDPVAPQVRDPGDDLGAQLPGVDAHDLALQQIVNGPAAQPGDLGGFDKLSALGDQQHSLDTAKKARWPRPGQGFGQAS